MRQNHYYCKHSVVFSGMASPRGLAESEMARDETGTSPPCAPWVRSPGAGDGRLDLLF